MTKRWLITRPAQEAAELASQLQARGHQTVLAPVIRIVPVDAAAIDLDGVQALLFTSANGVRAFARLDGRRGIRVLAVGEITAEAAREAGFAMVEAAGGNAAALAQLAAERLDPAAGALLHGAGRHLAGDLRAALEAAGFEVRQVTLYQAEAADHLPGPAIEALERETLDGVFFYSVRSAETFMRLAEDAGVRPHLAKLAALCLSRDVADRLASPDGPAVWGSIRIAARPDRAAMVALADDPEGSASTTNAEAGQQPAREDEAMVPADDPEQPDPGPPGAAAPPDSDAEAATAQVIQMFGGIRPMAHKLGAPVTTVQGWKRRGHIPETRHRDIAEAAERHHIDLPSLLLAATRPPDGDSPDAVATGETPAAPLAPDETETETEAPADGLAAEAAEPAPIHEPPVAHIEEPASHGTEAPEEAEYHMHPEPTRGGSGVAWLALLIALLAAAAATAPWWAPDQVASLTGALPPAALQDRIDALEQSVGAAAPGTALSQLDQRIAAVEGEAAQAAASAEQLEALVARLDAIEAAAGEGSAPAIAASLGELQRRITAVEQAAGAGAGAQDEALSAVTERLNGLEAEVGSLQSSQEATQLSEDIDAVGAQVAGLGTRVAAVEQASVRLDGLDSQLAALDQRLDAIEALNPAPGAAVESRLSALEAVDPVDEAALAARDEALSARVDQVTAQVARIDGALGDFGGLVGGLPAIETRVQALETAQTANSLLRQSLADLLDRVQRLGADIRETNQRFDEDVTGATAGLQRDIASVQMQVGTALSSTQDRLDRLSSQVDAELASMGATIEQLVAADTTTQALLLAVGQLQNTIERGQEYATALATVHSLAEDDPAFADELALLEEYAGAGIPSRRQLEAEFLPMAEAVRRADAVPPDADWLARTEAALEGLVSVRPVAGEVSGDNVPAILARAEGRLDHGDLAGAVDAMGALSGPPAAAAADWLAAANARLAAETALQTLTDRAVSRLTGVEPILPPSPAAEPDAGAQGDAATVDDTAGDTAAGEAGGASDAESVTDQPDAAGSDQPEAEAAEPEAEPEAVAPEAEQPDAAEPEAVEPDAAAPATDQPEAAAPATDDTGAEQPPAETEEPPAEGEMPPADSEDPPPDGAGQPALPEAEETGDPS